MQVQQRIKPTKTRKITMVAVMAALIYLMTVFVKVPLPSLNGAYINFGDIVIYICAYLLGGPVTALAAGIGSCLADLTVGAVIYAIPTLIIKALMGLTAGVLTKKQNFPSYLVACLCGGCIMVGGYALFEYFAFGAAYVITSLPMNAIQFGVSVGIALGFYKVVKSISGTFAYR